MTTSGITTYQLDRDDIITAAIRKLGVIAESQTPSAQSITDGATALNMLIAEFRGLGMPLWARKEFSFNPIAGQQVYNLGLTQTPPFNIAYPLHVYQAFRQDSSNATKVYMEVIPNFNLNLYPTSSGGTPVQVSYQPLINYGQLSLWPVPDSTATSSVVNIIYQSPFEYFNASTDTMAFPEEWYNALVYNLASNLAPEWTLPLQDREMLDRLADKHLQRVLDNGAEDGSLYVQPDRRGNWTLKS